MENRMENRRFLSLAFTIPIYIFIISMVFISIFAFMRFHLDFKNELNKINFKIYEIRKTQLKNIEFQLWNFNLNSLELILQGIVSIDDIVCARVVYSSPPKIISEGSVVEGDPGVIKRSFNLTFFNRNTEKEEKIGELEIFFSIRSIKEHVRKDNISIVIEETLEILIVAFFISIFLYILIIKPLNQLSHYARNFNLENLDEEFKFKRRIHFKFKDDIWMVANALNFMRASLKDAAGQLEKSLKTEAEIDAASKVQQFSLMGTAPLIPGYEVDFAYIPSREVSGDFYDIISYDDKFIIFIIGDVSGKGIPAGLTSHTARILIKSRKDLFLKPRDLLSFVNASMRDEIPENSYITLTEAVLDIENNFVTFLNAGHLPALLLRREQQSFVEIKPSGYPVSRFHNQYFDGHLETFSLQLEGGDILLIYTDGLVDALYEDQENTGYTRIKDIIMENREKPLDYIKEKIMGKVSSSLPEREDDLTMILIRKKG